MKEKEFRVPLENGKKGELVACSGTDPNYPGIGISYNKEGEPYETDLVYVELKPEEEKICIYVYGDPETEEQTNKFEIDFKELRRVMD